MARVEDESVHYVLPNHMMLKISTELPREMQGILACCNPVPPLVKQNLGVLHSILWRILGLSNSEEVGRGKEDLLPRHVCGWECPTLRWRRTDQ